MKKKVVLGAGAVLLLAIGITTAGQLYGRKFEIDEVEQVGTYTLDYEWWSDHVVTGEADTVYQYIDVKTQREVSLVQNVARKIRNSYEIEAGDIFNAFSKPYDAAGHTAGYAVHIRYDGDSHWTAKLFRVEYRE
jgi:hypothetical protein